MVKTSSKQIYKRYAEFFSPLSSIFFAGHLGLLMIIVMHYIFGRYKEIIDIKTNTIHRKPDIARK